MRTPTGGTYTVASAVTTAYPYGGSDYSISTDERGKVTIRRNDILDDCIETGETVFTNGVEIVTTKSRSYFGGGSSTRREWGESCFTEERRFDEYAADGRRTAYVVTESSDCGVVTNSAITYDLLGRAVLTTTPLAETVNAYDGNTSRVLTTSDAKSGVTTTCLYDACGEQIGTAVNGITNASVTTYAEISNETWKVVTDSVVGTSTNSQTVTRTRLTGLDAACRSETIIEGSQGGTTRTVVADDPDTGVRTESSDSTLTGEKTVESKHGIEFVMHEPSGVTTNSYDAFGRCARMAKGDVIKEYAYDSVGALIAARTLTATNALAETYSYDMLGQKVEVTDALGLSTYTSYDAVGNVVAEWGATYPVRSEYDTAGRRTALLTTRDTHRPELVTSITNVFGSTVRGLVYTYDGLSRPISRNDDSFGYNGRGEVAEAVINGNVETHAYDSIGNSVIAAFQSVTNTYAANALNQYTSVVGETTCAPTYNANGDLLTFGVWSFTYDDDSRLLTVSSNSVLLVTNAYDCQGRRVRKTTPEAVTTFLYDDWNLIRETVTYATGCVDALEYFWGRDLSGALQGAGGGGGLLYVKRDGMIYIPFVDATGNITAYADSTGTLVAEYVYDAFGRIIAQSGSLADVFRHRFSSKYFDSETGLYYYGYRFYHPALMRWMARDSIMEKGGQNLYGFCKNNPVLNVDTNGCAYFAYRPLKLTRWLGIVGNRQDDFDNTVIAHENLFFEDGKSPSNLGFFKTGVHDDPDNSGYAPPHSSGYNDCLMRKAASRVIPLPYSLLGGTDRIKYNCQDWAEEVRLMYFSMISGSVYYPKSTTFIGGR